MPKPPIPDVYLEIQDGALGLLPPPAESIHAKIGVAQAGPLNTIVPVTTLQQVRDTFQRGPLAEALALALAIGGGPIYAVRANASQPGSVTATGTSKTGSGNVTVTGSPNDSYEVIVRITRAGETGTAAFQYSLDGGDLWSAETAVPASGTYALPDTGLTLNFTNGATPPSFAAGDEYRFAATAPAMQLSDLVAALDALLADPREWAFVHVVGTATPTVAAAVATKMSEAEQSYRFAFAVLEARPQNQGEDHATWMSAITNEWQSFADLRVGVVAGHAEVVSPLSGRVHSRSLAWPYTGRLQAIPVHEHPGRVVRGPVPGIVSLQHDEQMSTGLDSVGFTTFRTIIGRRGFWVTNGRIKTPQGSDYQYVENRRVMDLSCRVARDAALRFLNESVRVDAQGKILEADAQRIERYVQGVLEAGVVNPGHASAVDVHIDRDSNILSTRTARITVRVRPLGYLSWIAVDIGFVNPKLVVAA